MDALNEFERFATLSRFLPFMPVFGGGHSKFQPVYVGNLARAIEISSRRDPGIESLTSGKIIEAGGPDSGCTGQRTSVCAYGQSRSSHVQANNGARTQVYEPLQAYRISPIRCWPTASNNSRAATREHFLPITRSSQPKAAFGVPSDFWVGGATRQG